MSRRRAQRPEAFGVRFGLGAGCDASGREGRRRGAGQVSARLCRFVRVLLGVRPRALQAKGCAPRRRGMFSGIYGELCRVVAVVFSTGMILFDCVVVGSEEVFRLEAARTGVFAAFTQLGDWRGSGNDAEGSEVCSQGI